MNIKLPLFIACLTKCLLIAGAIFSLAIFILGYEPWNLNIESSLDFFVHFSFIVGWCSFELLPYLVLYSHSNKFKSETKQSFIIFIGALLMTMLGIFIISTVNLIPHLMLILIILPFIQLNVAFLSIRVAKRGGKVTIMPTAWGAL